MSLLEAILSNRTSYFIIFRFVSGRSPSQIVAVRSARLIDSPRFAKEAAMEQPDPSPANSLSASTPAKPAKRSKTVPVPIVVGVICLGLGMAGGIVLGEYMGDRGKKYTDGGPQGTDSQAQADVMMKAKGGGGKGGGKGGKGGGKGGAPAGPKGGGPSSKAQLAQLVAKLDTLTAKPLTIQLSSEQKKQVHAVLTEIGMLGEMNDDDAKVKLDTLLRLLEDQKETFVAAGFAWPGYREPGRPPGAPLQNANIFRIGPDLEHFKSLESRLGK